MKLTWDQVNTWRLAQHGLAPRVGFMEAVQAQVMSAAELALWARVDGLRPSDVQAALWQERTLVKTWAMRGTLFLFAAKDLPLIVAARKIREYHYWFKHFESYGVSKAQYEKFLEAVPQVLGMHGSEPMTREQLAVAAAKHIGIRKLAQAVGESNWARRSKYRRFEATSVSVQIRAVTSPSCVPAIGSVAGARSTRKQRCKRSSAAT